MEEHEEYGAAPRSAFCVLRSTFCILMSTHLQEYFPPPEEYRVYLRGAPLATLIILDPRPPSFHFPLPFTALVNVFSSHFAKLSTHSSGEWTFVQKEGDDGGAERVVAGNDVDHGLDDEQPALLLIGDQI
jgi:hypothetical protein